MKEQFRIHDKVITQKGAGGLLREGIKCTVLIVNGENILIGISGSGNRYHVKANELLPQ